jgi:hypothetical protein
MWGIYPVSDTVDTVSVGATHTHTHSLRRSGCFNSLDKPHCLVVTHCQAKLRVYVRTLGRSNEQDLNMVTNWGWLTTFAGFVLWIYVLHPQSFTCNNSSTRLLNVPCERLHKFIGENRSHHL